MADLSNLYSSGNAIADLRSQIKSRAETDFNEAINAIDTQASDEENLFGTIQKAGASITAVGAIGKGVITNFAKLKAKLKKGDETSEDNPDAEAGDEGIEMETYQTAPRAPRQIEQDEPTEAEGDADAEPTEEPGLFDEGPDPFRGEEDEDVEGFEDTDTLVENAGDVDAPLFGGDVRTAPVEGEDFTPEEVAADFGGETGETTMSFTQATTGGLLERTDATIDTPTETTFEGAEVAEDVGETAEDAAGEIGGSITDTLSSIGSNISSTAGNVISSITNAASNAVSGAVDGASGAISGAVDAAGTAAATVAETGAEVGAEAALGTSLEVAGAAADSTGIGAIGGVILNIVGAIILGGTMAAGITGDVESQNQQSEATQQAQDNMNQQINAGYSNIAGRFAT